MKPTIFITGATGFLGRALLTELNWGELGTVYCLYMEKESIGRPEHAQLKWVSGELNDPDSYKSALNQSDIVIHMASITGKAGRAEYHKNIVDGTRQLIESSKKSAVKKFIYISSIAVKFKKKTRYFYAFAKEAAEEIVINSGIPYTIIRPTMIMGSGSAVFNGFEKFASLPVAPIFGNGATKIQPIHKNDLARILCGIIQKNTHRNDVVELGGTDQITINDFVKRLIKQKTGRDKVRKIHLPIGISVFGLRMTEPLFYRFLPITLGQLSSFRNDSTADDPKGEQILPKPMKNIDEIITDSLIQAPEPEIVADIDKPQLEKECRTFSRYLSGLKPDSYVIEKYIQYHTISNIEARPRFNLSDRFFVKFAKIHPIFTKFADIFTKFFKGKSLLRFKLSYLLAILEVSPPFYKRVDISAGLNKFSFLFLLMFKSGIFALQLFLSVLFLLPLDICLRIFGKFLGGNRK